jgi:hypothetical protein
MTIATELRNGDLPGLVELLRRQSDIKVDEVVSASRLRVEDGNLHIVGAHTLLDEDGVEQRDAVLAPTERFDEGVSEKLGIPRAYLRRMRDTGQRVVLGRPDDVEPADQRAPRLYDANVNGWLQADPTRKFLVRSFRTDNPDDTGIARALLSDQFRVGMDNLDVLLAVLDGVRAAGLAVDIFRCSLTERQMRVMLTAPAITAMAPSLLHNYRSPFSGRTGRELPLIFAGLDIRNSETGGGAFSLAPAAVFEVCTNGMTRQTEALRKAHLGVRLDEGVVRWSEETVRASTALVKSQAKDAVETFLDPAYLARWVDEIEGKAATPVSDAVGTIERVGKVHAFSEAEQTSILDCFIRSGDLTAGGVMQAVTAAAQSVESPDRQAEMEDAAMAVLDTAAA